MDIPKSSLYVLKCFCSGVLTYYCVQCLQNAIDHPHVKIFCGQCGNAVLEGKWKNQKDVSSSSRGGGCYKNMCEKCQHDNLKMKRSIQDAHDDNWKGN